MYWDIVEVIPESGHSLFVRFKDGLAGHVHLTAEDMIGVLAPLKEPDFFRQAFIEHGAVTWPGDIDLAPDAMYQEIAAQSRNPSS